MNSDHWISLYANQVGGLASWVNPTVVFFAEYFPYLVGIVFLFLAWRYAGTRLEKGRFLATGLVAVVVSRGVFVELIRFFIHRPRPFLDDHAIVALIKETSYSFPSGHAGFFFALATVVYLHNKRWGVWFFVASTIIGLARIMAGVHYPTDILGGAVLGVAVGYGVVRLTRKYFKSDVSISSTTNS